MPIARRPIGTSLLVSLSLLGAAALAQGTHPGGSAAEPGRAAAAVATDAPGRQAGDRPEGQGRGPGGGAAQAADGTRTAQAGGGGHGGGGQSGGAPGSGGGALQEREVGVVTLGRQQVPFIVTLPGRAVAFEETLVRPRVEGIIEEVSYQPGRPVEAGQVLFRMGTDTYETALAAAEAQRASAAAAVAVAEARAERDRRLSGVGATRLDLEASEAALAQAKAQLSSAEASLKTAQLNLDRAVIRSPISGIAGLPQVTVGTLVTANQAQGLVTITRMDPIYVDVAESSVRMLRVQGRVEDGDLSPGETMQAMVTLEDGRTHATAGRFVSPGMQVSTTTGTVQMRFEFDNPERQILPGQFLRVSLTLGTSQAILVPQRATRRGADGSLTALLARNGRAEQVVLTYTGTYHNAWIVTDGVSEGDRLIVDGLNNLRSGAAIRPVPVMIDSEGVVRDIPAGPPDDSGPVPAGSDQARPGPDLADPDMPIEAAGGRAAPAPGTPPGAAPGAGSAPASGGGN